jgi:hypothetical protein
METRNRREVASVLAYACVCYLMTRSATKLLAPNGKVDEWWTLQDLEGCGHCTIQCICLPAWTDWGKPQKFWVRIASVPAEIRTQYLPNTCLERYRYIKPFFFWYQNEKFWEELVAYFHWYAAGHIENDASNNFSIVACVFVTAVTSLPSRCLATIGGYTYRHTDRWEGFSISAVEMGSGAVLYVPSFIKIGWGIQKLIVGDTQTHTHRQQRDLISLLYFFKIRKWG